MAYTERRALQRLPLARPISAYLDGVSVLILDLGVLGALVEHDDQLETGQKRSLSFSWETKKVEVRCEVVRSLVKRVVADGERKLVFHSGLRFLEAEEGSDNILRRIISAHVTRIIAAQEANAQGIRERNRIDGDATITSLGAAKRAREDGYLSFRLEADGWKKTRTLDVEQPLNGFTVAAFEDSEQLQALCRAFEEADEQGRQLIRMSAELSLSDPSTDELDPL